MLDVLSKAQNGFDVWNCYSVRSLRTDVRPIFNSRAIADLLFFVMILLLCSFICCNRSDPAGDTARKNEAESVEG